MVSVLVLDDDADIVSAMAELLVEALGEGYQVEAHTSPVRALAAIAASPPDVIVTDLEMPWATGDDVIRAARLLKPDVGAILVSASVRSKEVARRVEAAHFRKPVDVDGLVEEVRRLAASASGRVCG